MSAVQVIACIAALRALPAQALQLVEASDGAAVEAILSIREPTRIRIEGASITDVFGNIHSSQCGLAAALPTGPGMTPAGTRSSPLTPAGELSLTPTTDKEAHQGRPAAATFSATSSRRSPSTIVIWTSSTLMPVCRAEMIWLIVMFGRSR